MCSLPSGSRISAQSGLLCGCLSLLYLMSKCEQRYATYRSHDITGKSKTQNEERKIDDVGKTNNKSTQQTNDKIIATLTVNICESQILLKLHGMKESIFQVAFFNRAYTSDCDINIGRVSIKTDYSYYV